MAVYDEMTINRIRVQADRTAQPAVFQIRQVTSHRRTDVFDLLFRDRPPHVVRRRHITGMVLPEPDTTTSSRYLRHTIEEQPVVVFSDEHRQLASTEPWRISLWHEPVHDVTLDLR
jgi:hypothetical protein